MPTCQVIGCENAIPSQIMVEGRRVTLHHRRFCLSCSPFKARRGQSLWGEQNYGPTDEVLCSNCGKVYTYSRKNRKGCSRTKCNSCCAARKRRSSKKDAVDYLGGKCWVCGYSKSMRALVFHHKDPNEKKFSIGGSQEIRWEKLVKELDKCVLLCANCHAEAHDSLIEIPDTKSGE